jgi:hypothetical protein
LPVLVFLLTLPAALATPLDVTGIPANADGVIHLDADAAAKSSVASLVCSQLAIAAGLNDAEHLAQFKAKLGLDPVRDIGAITFGIFVNPQKDTAQKDAAQQETKKKHLGVFILRGRFSSAKWIADAIAKGAKPRTVGKHTFVDADKLVELPFLRVGNVAIGAAGDNALLVADAPLLEAVVAALDDPAKHGFSPPADFGKFATQAGPAPVVLALLGEKIFPQNLQPPPPTGSAAGAAAGSAGEFLSPVTMPTIRLVIGEDGELLKTRVVAEYITTTESQKGRAGFQTLLKYFGIRKDAAAGAGVDTDADGRPDPAKAERRVRINRLYDAIHLTGEGRFFNISLDYPAADARLLIAPKQ